MLTSEPNVAVEERPAHITRQQWKWSALAGMASYLDAGSIVALGVGMSLFQQYLKLEDSAVGLLAAIGPNAIGCAIGAFIGGRLGDKLGRKRIYQYDLLVYAAGILCIACAVNAPMLFIGTFVVGLAVGADVPTSLALVGEFAPAKSRGKLLGVTQVAWCLGPAIVLWMAALLARFNHSLLKPGDPVDPNIAYGNPNDVFMGMIGARIVFIHLLIVALITWAMRRGLAESARWVAASTSVRKGVGALFAGANLRALLWTTVIYTFQNLAGGTAGQFNSYFIETLHVGTQAQGAAMYSMAFVTAMLVTWLIFMQYSDRSFAARKWIWGLGSIMQIIAYGMFMFLPFTPVTVITNIIMFAGGAALAGEAMYKVFSQELFPTMLRGTAQGFSFGIARFSLGIWSYMVPMLLGNKTIDKVAIFLTLFLLISGVVGFFGMPDTSGKSLEQIESERAGADGRGFEVPPQ